MRTLAQTTYFLLVAGAVSGLAGVVSAADRGQATPAPAGPLPVAQAPEPATIGQPLDLDALDTLRGGETLIVTKAHNEGEVNGNHAENISSGLNAIDGGAFANAAGITTVIQNSGSNVLIQNGTAVNIQFMGQQP